MPDRAGLRDLLRHGASGTIQLRGTDEGERDSTVIVALTRIDGQPCVVVGQDRARQAPSHRWVPARCARRGAACGSPRSWGSRWSPSSTPRGRAVPGAEEHAIAGEIARCIATLTTMTVPTVSVILGQGCGEGRWPSCLRGP